MSSLAWQAKWGLLVLIWGSSFLFMKVGLKALAPLQISTLRVPSALAGIGNAITPIATVVLTLMFVRDEQFSPARMAGSCSASR